MAYGAPDLNVYAIADRLEARGWTVDRQHRPAAIHLTVTANHAPIVDDYLADLARRARRGPRRIPSLAKSGSAPMYGMAAQAAGAAARRRERAQDDRGDVLAGGHIVEKRIAFARIAQETNALSPVDDDAARLRGQPLPRRR